MIKKSTILITTIIFMATLFYANHRFGLLSMAGLNGKGLPAKKVTGNSLALAMGSSHAVDHSLWTQLLKKHVSPDGSVDYKGFLQDKGQLEDYLGSLSKQAPMSQWAVQEQLAYYINLYNAHTVYLILKHYPVKSIKDIPGAWTKDVVKIGDVAISLGGLEHSILRKMDEPRIHFAINCASASCPVLLNEAFEPARLEAQLERVTAGFVNSDNNTLTRERVVLSKIFKWYKNDFPEGDLVQFINRYSGVNIAPGAKIRYREYDWGLNEKD